jgi:hypothetical protein
VHVVNSDSSSAVHLYIVTPLSYAHNGRVAFHNDTLFIQKESNSKILISTTRSIQPRSHNTISNTTPTCATCNSSPPAPAPQSRTGSAAAVSRPAKKAFSTTATGRSAPPAALDPSDVVPTAPTIAARSRRPARSLLRLRQLMECTSRLRRRSIGGGTPTGIGCRISAV